MGRSSQDFYFQPESGWCWRVGENTLEAEHPGSGTVLDFTNHMVDSLSSLLKDEKQPQKFLEPMKKLDIPGLDHMVKSLREYPVRASKEIKELKGLNDPSRLWIEVQGNCNEQCVHCYASSGPFDLPSLDRHTVTKLVRQAEDLSFDRIQFTGGDPLLWDPLPELVSLTRDFGLIPEIYTNGLALTDSLLDRLEDSDPHFSFSFYSYNSQVHDDITNVEGSWNQTLSALSKVQDADLSYRVAVVEMAENRGQISRTETFLNQRGVPTKNIHSDRIRGVGRAESHLQQGDDVIPDGDSRKENPESVNNKGKLCVSYRGEVVPCIFQRSLSFGSVHERSLGDIIARPRLKSSSEPGEKEPETDDTLSCGDCRFHRTVLTELLEQAKVT